MRTWGARIKKGVRQERGKECTRKEMERERKEREGCEVWQDERVRKGMKHIRKEGKKEKRKRKKRYGQEEYR